MTTLNYTWQKLVVYKLVTDLQSFTLMMASTQVVETPVNTNNIYMGLINKVDMVCLSPVGYGV